MMIRGYLLLLDKNYFVNIGPTLASKINSDNVSHCDIIPLDMNASFSMEPTNETEISLVTRENNGYLSEIRR